MSFSKEKVEIYMYTAKMAKLAKWFTILKNSFHIPIRDRGEATRQS